MIMQSWGVVCQLLLLSEDNPTLGCEEKWGKIHP